MERKIAEERIRRLLDMAKERTKEGEKSLSSRYIELARKIGMSYNVPIPSELKRNICSECNSYLIPGKNCKVRINSKRNTVNYKCEACGEINRYGF